MSVRIGMLLYDACPCIFACACPYVHVSCVQVCSLRCAARSKRLNPKP
jgi:hypothetical protein